MFRILHTYTGASIQIIWVYVDNSTALTRAPWSEFEKVTEASWQDSDFGQFSILHSYTKVR